MDMTVGLLSENNGTGYLLAPAYWFRLPRKSSRTVLITQYTCAV